MSKKGHLTTLFGKSAQHLLSENQDSFIRCFMLGNQSPLLNKVPQIPEIQDSFMGIYFPTERKACEQKNRHAGMASSLQPCRWMQPVPAFTTKNFNYFLQAAQHHLLQLLVEMQSKCRWVLSITVLTKTSGRNHRKKPFGHFKAAHPSQETTVKPNYTMRVKSLCSLGFLPIQWTIKRQLWIANPVPEIFDSSQKWEQCRQQWSKHTNKVPPNVSQL